MNLSVSWKKILILGLASALAFFIIFKTSVSIQDFSHIFKALNTYYFWLAFATIIPSILLNSVRWYFVLRASGFNISFGKVFKITTSSISLSVVPGRLGDLARSYPLRDIIPVHQSIGTIILEKIIDISVLCGYAGIGLALLGFPVGSFIALSAAVFAIPILYLVHVFGKNFANKNNFAKKLYEASLILPEARKRKGLFILATLSSVANWGVSILQNYLLFMAIGITVPFIALIAYLPLSIFVGLLPITLAGAGTRDAAMIHFFSSFASAGQALSVGILYGLQAYWIPAILGLPLLRYFFKDTK